MQFYFRALWVLHRVEAEAIGLLRFFNHRLIFLMCDLQPKIGTEQLLASTQSDPRDEDNYLITVL